MEAIRTHVERETVIGCPMPDEPETPIVHPVRRFHSGWRASALSVPATEFTGDFYMTCEIDDVVWFAVGDFSGHGLGAAIFTMMVREELERSIDYCRNRCLVEIVARLDSILRDELPSNRFASLVVGRAERDGRVALVNAGHCLPLLFRSSGEVETVATGDRSSASCRQHRGRHPRSMSHAARGCSSTRMAYSRRGTKRTTSSASSASPFWRPRLTSRRRSPGSHAKSHVFRADGATTTSQFFFSRADGA